MTDTVTIDQLQAALDFFENVSVIIEERQGQYAGPVENYARIKAGWDQIFGIDIPVSKIPLAMTWLKVARQINAINTDQPNDDDWYDIAGYASNGFVLSEQEKVSKAKAEAKALEEQEYLKELAAKNQAEEKPNKRSDDSYGLLAFSYGQYDWLYPREVSTARETKTTAVLINEPIEKEALRLSAFGAMWLSMGYRVEYTLEGKVVGWAKPGDTAITWLPAEAWQK